MQILIVILLLCSILLSGYIVYQSGKNKDSKSLDVTKRLLENIENSISRFEGVLKDELSRSRMEFNQGAKTSREELSISFNTFSTSLSKQIVDIATFQKNQLDAFSTQINQSNKEGKEDLGNSLKSFSEVFSVSVKDLADSQKKS